MAPSSSFLFELPTSFLQDFTTRSCQVSGDDELLFFRHARLPVGVLRPPLGDVALRLQPIAANHEGEVDLGVLFTQGLQQVLRFCSPGLHPQKNTV